MNNLFDEFDVEQDLTDKNIFTEIWTSPNKVFRFINERHYDKFVTLLLTFAGISRAFDRAQMKNMGDKMPIILIVGTCVITGLIFGWISYYIYSALISWTGKWLKGEADAKSINRILSYAMIPSIVALVFLIPQIGVYGEEIFKSDGNITSAGWFLNIIVYGSKFIRIILGIWTVVLCVIGISQVQKFSIGKSILNLLLPAIIIVVPITIILLIIIRLA